ncbi:MAG: hypothetical protein H6Q67_2173 [Firmicutes bacterium]|nr:hypothetical protein [Bacillota bacterium]
MFYQHSSELKKSQFSDWENWLMAYIDNLSKQAYTVGRFG